MGPYDACMCGDGFMSRDGGFQAVRAAGENLQIRTLFNFFKYIKKKNGTGFFDDLVESTLLAGGKTKKIEIWGIQLEDRQIQDLQLCTPWTGLVL